MAKSSVLSNIFVESARNWQYPPFTEEKGQARVVAFGDHSHKCPIYVRQLPPCTGGCPAGNDIRAWLTTVQQTGRRGRAWRESYEIAWHAASRTTPFPATCGRVCPAPCEGACNREKKDGQPVNISAFERWLGDYAIERGLEHQRLRPATSGKRIAVVGGGPASLSCAFQLARRGWPVTVYEAKAEPGGMMRYGIPAFRLPRPVLDAEIAAISRMGVEIICNSAIGTEDDLAELHRDFAAVFVGIGAQRGTGLDLPGENAANVYSGVTFLRRVNAGESVSTGNRVVVVGGGNTAVTAARAARRLGAAVTILYRRTRAEMPTLEREIEDSLLEGVTIRYLTAPVGIRTENGRAVAVSCLAMELGEPDASGRRRAVPVAGSEFELPCTALISAIGQLPETAELGLSGNSHGWLTPKPDWSVGEGLYAGGDVTGLALVTTAIGHGRLAAEEIDARLTNRHSTQPFYAKKIGPESLRLSYYPEIKRNEQSWVAAEKRLGEGLALEVDFGLSEAQFRSEAERCMSCGLCFECRQCLIFCPQQAIEEFPSRPVGKVMYTHYTRCVGCHICARSCPCGYIQMGMSDEL